jgi:mono/diheme cytochrome c family protein
MKKAALIFLFFGTFLLAGCNFSLAEDVTPPPGYQPQEPVVAQADTTPAALYPLVPPDPAAGKAIFAEKCAPCHGESGLGNGERANDLPNPAAPIGSPDLARNASPVEWFNIVTQGNVERFMPPFSSLTDRQRWDVVAYAFTLSEDHASVSQGARLYDENCASCHGPRGRGDGQQAGSFKPIDFTRQDLMANKSAAEFFETISAGVSPGMPAYADKLSEADRWSLTNYVRSLSFAAQLAEGVRSTPYPGASNVAAQASPYPNLPTEPAASATLTGTVATTQSIGTITGIVMNSSGGSIPAGADVMLHAFDQMQLVYTATTTLKADGTYAFDQVEVAPQRSFLATVDYGNVVYGSDIQTAQDGQNTLELPIQVYESTTDPSGLSADRVHYFFEFVDAKTIRVVELFIITNNASKTLVAAKEGQGVVDFSLPVGATNLEFQDGEIGGRYLKTADGFADTAPVRPGSGSYQVLFSYDMPYNRKLDLVSQMPLDTNAVVILVPEQSVKVKGPGIVDAGTRDVQGTPYHMYNGSSLQKGQVLSLTVTGEPAATGTASTLLGNSNFIIGLGALGVVMILAGVWMYQRSRSKGAPDEEPTSPIRQEFDSSEAVMDAILALDDLYQEGRLPEEAYLQRRGELKARLKEFIGHNG